MRIVLTGTPGVPHVLQPSDLPVDLNLRHSYWRYVDFSGFDLSAYDMRDMDILDCNGDNSVLGIGKTALLMSRRTTWRNATLPSDISSYNHDFVVEVYTEWLETHTALAVTAMRNYVAGDYARSWQDAIQILVNQGMTVPQMKARFTPIFTPYPKLLERMNYHLDNRLWTPQPPVWINSKDEEGFDWGGHINSNDRWASARILEQLILNNRGRVVRCYFLQLDPSIVLRVIDKDDANFPDPLWWFKFRES